MDKLYYKTFMWLFVGVFVSFLTGYLLYLNQTILLNTLSSKVFWLLFIVEIGIAIFFSARISKMSQITAIFCYLLYSFTTGFTIGSLFMVYKISSMILVFGISSVLFLLLALYGYFTKRSLNRISTFLIVGLIGVIICTIINIFLNNTVFDIILNVIGIALFLGFIAYDIQNLKALDDYVGENKASVFGAFQLYLDFINLFIRLLELFGKVKD